MRRREAGGERRERVEQDAPDQHAPPAEAVGQVAAEQAEDAAGERRHVEQQAHPGVERRACPARTPSSSTQRRPHDQRQHQQLVDVEREAERGDDADQPLGGGQRAQFGRGRGHEAVLCASFPPEAQAPARGDARGPARRARGPEDEASRAELRRVLLGEGSHAVARAAAIIGELELAAFVDELVAAFPRFFDDLPRATPAAPPRRRSSRRCAASATTTQRSTGAPPATCRWSPCSAAASTPRSTCAGPRRSRSGRPAAATCSR